MKVSFAGIEDASAGAFSEGCSTRTVLDHIMSKWGVLVLSMLTDGTLRWGELRRRVDGISEKMLATTLKTLQADGLVHRESFPTVPPHVEYSLTPLGLDLMERLLPLMEWVSEHADEMVDAGRNRRTAPATATTGTATAGTATAPETTTGTAPAPAPAGTATEGRTR